MVSEDIPETIVKILCMGETSEGERVPIRVDSEGRVVTTEDAPAE